jgi:delta 1-pyrroline-5-carboxylate dehydrogenase
MVDRSGGEQLDALPLAPVSARSPRRLPLAAFSLAGLAGFLDKEVFGPVLHVICCRGDRLDAVVDAVNSTGYGLTLGLHRRIEDTWQRV